MSDVATLGARLRAIAAGLPTGRTRRAATALDEGRTALLHALRDSTNSAGTQQFRQATDLLGTTVRHLAVAADHLDDYLRSIGLAGIEAADPSTPTASSVGPAGSPPDRADWWRQRINLISDGDTTATSSQEVTVTGLFSQLVDRARAGDRDGYRARLLAAGPATGSRLPGVSWPMIRSLTTDLLGHSPTSADNARLRRLVDGPVAAVLPKLPDDVLLSPWHGASGAPHPDHAGIGHHPADIAAVGPAIVAALLRERPGTQKDA